MSEEQNKIRGSLEATGEDQCKEFYTGMINRCRAFLIDYLAENGPTRPGTFKNDIVGGMDLEVAFIGMIPRWNKSPFCPALGTLVTDGTVIAVEDREGWLYYLANEKNHQREEIRHGK